MYTKHLPKSRRPAPLRSGRARPEVGCFSNCGPSLCTTVSFQNVIVQMIQIIYIYIYIYISITIMIKLT